MSSPGLFEMCNPHLLSTETLAQQIRTRLWLPVFSVDRSQLGWLQHDYPIVIIKLFTFQLIVM